MMKHMDETILLQRKLKWLEVLDVNEIYVYIQWLLTLFDDRIQEVNI